MGGFGMLILGEGLVKHEKNSPELFERGPTGYNWDNGETPEYLYGIHSGF